MLTTIIGGAFLADLIRIYMNVYGIHNDVSNYTDDKDFKYWRDSNGYLKSALKHIAGVLALAIGSLSFLDQTPISIVIHIAAIAFVIFSIMKIVNLQRYCENKYRTMKEERRGKIFGR